jgi:hypothetical protein
MRTTSLHLLWSGQDRSNAKQERMVRTKHNWNGAIKSLQKALPKTSKEHDYRRPKIWVAAEIDKFKTRCRTSSSLLLGGREHLHCLLRHRHHHWQRSVQVQRLRRRGQRDEPGSSDHVHTANPRNKLVDIYSQPWWHDRINGTCCGSSPQGRLQHACASWWDTSCRERSHPRSRNNALGEPFLGGKRGPVDRNARSVLR